MQSPIDIPKPSKLRSVAVLGALAFGLALIWQWSSFGRPVRSQEAADEISEDRKDPVLGDAVAGSGSDQAFEPGLGVVKEGERPAGQPHEEMYFLQFRYDAGKITMHRGQRIDGIVKRQRSLMGKTGIYYRSLSGSGSILADGVLPDPRVLHYTLPEGEPGAATIRSGSIPLEQTEFVVRVPALEGSSTVELFSVSPEDAAVSQFAGQANMLGAFPLTVAASSPQHER